MLSFADKRSNEPKLTLKGKGPTFMAYWIDPVTGMGASGGSSPWVKK